MKYNQYAIQNKEGDYIKYGRAYSYDLEFTDSLYDPHLWSKKEDAIKLLNYLKEVENVKGLTVVKV